MYTYLGKDKNEIPNLDHVKNKNQLYNSFFFKGEPEHNLLTMDNETKLLHDKFLKRRCGAVDPTSVQSSVHVKGNYVANTPGGIYKKFVQASKLSSPTELFSSLEAFPTPPQKKGATGKLNQKSEDIQAKISKKTAKLNTLKKHRDALHKQKKNTKDKKKLEHINKALVTNNKKISQVQKEIQNLKKQKAALERSKQAHEKKPTQTKPHQKPKDAGKAQTSTQGGTDDAIDLSDIDAQQAAYRKKRTEVIVGVSVSVFLILVILGLVYYYYRT